MTNVQVFQVTPELAAQWLATQERNRAISGSRVNELIAAISRGEWRLTNDAIAFDDQGCLINGQHRLTAIVRSNRTLPLLVIDGLNSDTFLVMDTGLRRTAAQALSLEGKPNSKALSAGARLAYQYEHNSIGRKTPLTNEQIYRYVEAKPALEQWVGLTKSISNHIPIAPSALLAFACIASEYHDASDLVDFFTAIEYGDGLLIGDPRLAFRNWIINRNVNKSDGQRATLELALLIKAFNYWTNGQSAQHLKSWRFGDQFPRIEKPTSQTTLWEVKEA